MTISYLRPRSLLLSLILPFPIPYSLFPIPSTPSTSHHTYFTNSLPLAGFGVMNAHQEGAHEATFTPTAKIGANYHHVSTVCHPVQVVLLLLLLLVLSLLLNSITTRAPRGNKCKGWRWDGMGWDGMGWDGMGWDGMGWDGMAWHGMGWHGMGWHGMR